MPDRTGHSLEFSRLYQQQQEWFRNPMMVLGAALLLVFLVLLVEFRLFLAPLAIVWGSLLSLTGVVLALWLTGTSLNIVSFLGVIIGIGIVAKNGILRISGRNPPQRSPRTGSVGWGFVRKPLRSTDGRDVTTAAKSDVIARASHTNNKFVRRLSPCGMLRDSLSACLHPSEPPSPKGCYDEAGLKADLVGVAHAVSPFRWFQTDPAA